MLEGENNLGEPKQIDKNKLKLELNSLFENKWLYWLGLIPILAISLWIRTRNLKLLDGKYMLGLDPYYYYRITGYVLDGTIQFCGSVPCDMMRNYPLGTTLRFSIFPYFLAVWHKLVEFFTSQPRTYSHIIYPAVIGVIGLIFFFLFIREIFDSKTALVATGFLAVVPAYLYRTLAGFADHESIAMLLMFASFWLFALFRKETQLKKKLTFAALSGLVATSMALTFAGFTLLTVSIALFVTLEILLGRVSKEYSAGYLIWVLIFAFPLLLFKGLYGYEFSGLAGWLGSALPFLPLAAFGFYYGFKQINLKLEKISLGFQSILVSAAVFGGGFLWLRGPGIIEELIHPSYGSAGRVGQTISEAIGGTMIWSSFHWIAIIGLLGAVYLVYKVFEEDKKIAIGMSAAFAAFIGVTLFGGLGTRINLVVLGLFAVILLFLSQKQKEKFSHTRILYLLPLLAFIFTAYLSSAAARFMFIFAPWICLVAGFGLATAAQDLWNFKSLRFLIIGLIVIFFALVFVNAQVSAAQASHAGSGLSGQWWNAMQWIKTNTPEDAAIAHWWDYGYWTQSVAERASIKDGSLQGSYELFLLGRYGMTAFDDTKALSYFKTRDIDYLLYSKEEIPKYHAFSFIGSNEELDRESTVGIFSFVQSQEVRNGTRQLYSGGWGFDDDIVSGNLVLPRRQAVLGGFIFTENNGKLIEAPTAVIIYNGQQYERKINCIYTVNNEKITFDVDNSIGGCIKFVPYFKSPSETVPNGGIFYLSPHVEPGLFARLYILNQQIEGFNEVYNDGTPLGLYSGRIIGPTRIWKIEYPDDIKTNPAYLEYNCLENDNCDEDYAFWK